MFVCDDSNIQQAPPQGYYKKKEAAGDKTKME
jgi:hypothetical protein